MLTAQICQLIFIVLTILVHLKTVLIPSQFLVRFILSYIMGLKIKEFVAIYVSRIVYLAKIRLMTAVVLLHISCALRLFK